MRLHYVLASIVRRFYKFYRGPAGPFLLGCALGFVDRVATQFFLGGCFFLGVVWLGGSQQVF